MLTPTQERVLAELIDLGGPRPDFDRQLARRLREELDGRATTSLDAVDAPGSPNGPAWRRGQDRPVLVVGKRLLGSVHSCERRALAEDEAGFTWTAATAHGAVAHKALELGAQVARPAEPADLVAMAIDRLIDDDQGPARWLHTATPAERAELTSRATDVVTKFEDSFPPIPTRWRPRVESRLRLQLANDRVELSGKVDLALGRAEGTQARVLIIDLKTGRPSMNHTADLRFYALLETLRVGIPPFRVASFYLDGGEWRSEDVTPEVLSVTVRRVADGIDRLIGLRLAGRPATATPGPPCRYCPARPDCPEGQAWRPSTSPDDPDAFGEEGEG
jgi:hypothetical protein